MYQDNHQINLKYGNEDPSSWVDQEALDIVFVFAGKEGLDNALPKVNFSYDWVFSPQKTIKYYVICMMDMSFLFMNVYSHK